MSDTTGQAPAIPEETVELRTVALTLCVRCLAGSGGECHSPGCALWMNRAPDLAVEPLAGRTVVELPERYVAMDGSVTVWTALGHVQAYNDQAGKLRIDAENYDWRGDDAVELAKAILVVHEHMTRRLASESGQDGEPDA